MASKAGVGFGAHDATVRSVSGPVPPDDPSHALRLSAATDLVRRCRIQLANAEADLARLTPKEN